VRETTEGFEDFRGQMWLAVHEGAFLFELPLGAIDHTRHGVVQHGPWPPEECSRCLLTWFDHGWITLYVLSEQLFRWSSDDDALMKDPADENVRIVEETVPAPSWRNPEDGPTTAPKGSNGVCRGCLAGSALVAAGGSALLGADPR
jgi:hypothetical protein